MMGLRFTPVKPLDGKSLVPLLKGKTKNWPNRILFMDTQRMLNLTKYKNYTVMDNNWRLVDGDKLHDVTNDLKQAKNVISLYPKEEERLALGYESWWQSLIDEGVNERYAYIKVGTPYENPSRIMSHDMLTGNLGNAWHQFGAITATQASGFWKIEFVEDGDYKISLRRFPRESGLKINATFPAEEKTRRIEQPAPASTKDDFVKAFLYVGKHKKTVDIEKDVEEVTFTLDIAAGKYDMQAELIDELGRVYPSYYLYIEKL
jgi:hypothetical protein